MENDADFVQVVVGLGGPAGDPGGLAQPELALDDQRVRRVAAGGVPVVELVSLEEAVGVEEVGSGEELRSRPHLAPGGDPASLQAGRQPPPALRCPRRRDPGFGRREAERGGAGSGAVVLSPEPLQREVRKQQKEVF